MHICDFYCTFVADFKITIMKHKIFLLCFALLWSGGALFAKGQVRMQLLNEQQQMDAAKTLGKTVFYGSKMTVFDVEGNLVKEFTVTEELKIEVTENAQAAVISDGVSDAIIVEVPTGLDNTALSVLVGPNPASDFISIRNATKGETVRIYGLNGTIIKQTVVADEVTYLPVSDIPAGTYLLSVSNNLIKLIKQ